MPKIIYLTKDENSKAYNWILMSLSVLFVLRLPKISYWTSLITNVITEAYIISALPAAKKSSSRKLAIISPATVSFGLGFYETFIENKSTK